MRPALLARLTTLALVVLAAAAPAATSAEPARPLALLPESKLWLEGDSTLHPYHANATRWTLTASMAPRPGNQPVLTELEAIIPVMGLKSGDGALDANMYKALKAEEHPAIHFLMASSQVRVSGADAVSADLTGALEVAGVEKPTTLHAEGRLDDGVFRVSGRKTLSMKAFGVEPPVLLLGAIRVADAIVIRYEVAIKRPAGKP